jgi:hypothetical protein
MLTKYISFPIFIISFFVGLILIYIFNFNNKKTIHVYPSPENVNKLIFKDSADNCFYFDELEVPCPSNIEQLSSIPIQE